MRNRELINRVSQAASAVKVLFDENCASCRNDSFREDFGLIIADLLDAADRLAAEYQAST